MASFKYNLNTQEKHAQLDQEWERVGQFTKIFVEDIYYS